MPTNTEDWSSPENGGEAFLEAIKAKVQPANDGDNQISEANISQGPMTIKPNLKSYIGTKVILARPMTEYEYLKTVKRKTAEELSNQETQGDGYEVTYEDNYISWSPKAVFERCYREITVQEKSLIQTGSVSSRI